MPLFAAATILIPGADIASNAEGHELAVVIDAASGAVVGTWAALPTAECGDILPSGVWAIAAQTIPAGAVTSIDVYGADSVLIASVPVPVPPLKSYEFSPIRSDGTQFYYEAIPGSVASGSTVRLFTVSAAGVLGGTIWSLPSDANRGASAMAPARDGSVVYYGKSTGSVVNSTAVGRYDLVNLIQLSDLVPALTGQFIGRDLLVLTTGDIIVIVLPPVADRPAGTLWQVRRYNPAGTLQATLLLPTVAAFGDQIELAPDTDVSKVWVRSYPDTPTGTTKFQRVVASTMTEDRSFTALTYAGGGLLPVSCPFLVYPDLTPPPPPPPPPTPEEVAGVYVTVPIRRVRQAPHVAQGLQWQYYDAFELDMDTGRGLPAGQGRDPQVMLQWSDDGGHTWSHEHWLSAGLQGQYGRRVQWARLGRSRDRVFRIAVSDPVPWSITDAILQVRAGES